MSAMPAWAQEHFPATHDMAVGWKPIVTHVALHMCVLCVATTRMEGKWVAYTQNVPGDNHKCERDWVLDHGDKLPESIALAIFPDWKGIPYDS